MPGFGIIKSESQYKDYCKLLEKLLAKDPKTEQDVDDIELLTLLIRKWDQDHSTYKQATPIQLLLGLMDARRMKAKDLVSELNISKSHVSDILNQKKSLSKEIIRKLSDFFSMPQEAFNRPYPLVESPKVAAKTQKKVQGPLQPANTKKT